MLALKVYSIHAFDKISILFLYNHFNSLDILLFYPLNLYKIQARTQTSGKNARLFQKYNSSPRIRHQNYHQRMRMINNKNKKEEKRLTRTIFESFWGGSKRYTRGKQSFGNIFTNNNIKLFNKINIGSEFIGKWDLTKQTHEIGERLRKISWRFILLSSAKIIKDINYLCIFSTKTFTIISFNHNFKDFWLLHLFQWRIFDSVLNSIFI